LGRFAIIGLSPSTGETLTYQIGSSRPFISPVKNPISTSDTLTYHDQLRSPMHRSSPNYLSLVVDNPQHYRSASTLQNGQWIPNLDPVTGEPITNQPYARNISRALDYMNNNHHNHGEITILDQNAINFIWAAFKDEGLNQKYPELEGIRRSESIALRGQILRINTRDVRAVFRNMD
jgi:hypothetical protein